MIEQLKSFLHRRNNFDINISRESAKQLVGDGWGNILDDLYDAKPGNVKVIQVKEKFGSLRFYVIGEPNWYSNLIEFYEKKSTVICEFCGRPGKLRNDIPWMKTMCDSCYERCKI